MRSKRGSLILFLALVLPGLVLFAGGLMDVIRIKASGNLLEEALMTSMDSVLADYDRNLRERFGLFALREKDYGRDLEACLVSNLRYKGIEVLGSEVSLVRDFLEPGVLRGQVLEEMKIRGLVNLSKEFLGVVEAFQEVSSVQGGLSQYGSSPEEVVSGIQAKVALNVSEIKGLEERQSAGEEGLSSQIEGLYQSNKELLVVAENLSGGEGLGAEGGDGIESNVGPELFQNLQSIFKEEFPDLEGSFVNPSELYFRGKAGESRVREVLLSGLLGFRDRFLLGEYVLEMGSTYVGGGSGEVEKILGDGYGGLGLLEVLVLRSFLDGVGYFVLDPMAPPEPFSRLLYAAGRGFVQGAQDLWGFLSVEDSRVPLVNGVGLLGNPFEGVRLSYRNHLELLLLGTSEERILEGIYGLVSREFPGRLYAGVEAGVSGRVGLWFLSFLPDEFSLLGGVMEDGALVLEARGSLVFH